MIYDGAKCENCHFFVPRPNGLGRCQRYAPRPTLDSDETGIDAEWPIIEPGNFCGEHQPVRKK